jgi:hypothetical protein
MLETVVKFVDDGDYFITAEGNSIRLYTVNAMASSGTITVTAKSEFDAGDYLIVPTPDSTYYVWFDKTGDGTTDDPAPSGFDTDAGVVVDVSDVSTAVDVATALANALDALEDVAAAVDSDGDVNIVVETAGSCNAISDPTCGFTLSNILGGIDAGGVVKTGTTSKGNRVEEIRDLDYVSSTDTLTTLAKVETKVLSTNPRRPGYVKTSAWQVIEDTNWVLG